MAGAGVFNMKNRDQKRSILFRISSIEEQIARLSEKLYNPELSTSDQKKINKLKKKLDKDKNKLYRKLNEYSGYDDCGNT